MMADPRLNFVPYPPRGLGPAADIVREVLGDALLDVVYEIGPGVFQQVSLVRLTGCDVYATDLSLKFGGEHEHLKAVLPVDAGDLKMHADEDGLTIKVPRKVKRPGETKQHMLVVRIMTPVRMDDCGGTDFPTLLTPQTMGQFSGALERWLEGQAFDLTAAHGERSSSPDNYDMYVVVSRGRLLQQLGSAFWASARLGGDHLHVMGEWLGPDGEYSPAARVLRMAYPAPVIIDQSGVQIRGLRDARNQRLTLLFRRL
jgi:hypothetical protein